MTLVLVADDDRIVSHLASALLRNAGYTVETRADVAGTVVRMQSAPLPDCVLLDVNMPDGTAADVLERTATGESAAIPVIMLTGSSPDVMNGFRTNPRVRAVLSKPVSPGPLLEAMGRVFPPDPTR